MATHFDTTLRTQLISRRQRLNDAIAIIDVTRASLAVSSASSRQLSVTVTIETNGDLRAAGLLVPAGEAGLDAGISWMCPWTFIVPW